jgi:hypothetical protein
MAGRVGVCSRSASPALRDFVSLRVEGPGFKATVQRQLNFDSASRKLYDFWKSGGKVDPAKAARITACMRELGIGGSVTSLVNAGTETDRNRVLAGLGLQ